MIPQIIYLTLMLVGWLHTAYLHGQPKSDDYNIFSTMISSIIILILLYSLLFFYYLYTRNS